MATISEQAVHELAGFRSDDAPVVSCYLDVDDNGQTLTLPTSSLGFTWCQVPILYVLDDDADAGLVAEFDDGSETSFADLNLPGDISAQLFQRSGRVRKITATFGASRLFGD